ncbi:MAG TPA: cellulase family glycosylhydrolase [Alphaproteobacteria bacterium]|nr:cellulase family glycosylhydrolase [Alphaproteobacteria bacterium]
MASVIAAWTAPGPAKAADAAQPNLRHGVNLSNWFTDFQRQPLTAHDFDQIKAAGFDHVRIPLNPESLGFSVSEASTGRVLFDFAGLDDGINLARERGLSVILDVQPSDSLASEMEQDPRTEPAMIALWHHIAEHYKDISAGTIAYELVDEPRYNSVAAYRSLVSDIVSGLHDVAANNTIIVDMPKQATLDGFDGFTPLPQETVRYAFHFYEPYLFTHQGMKLGSNFGRNLRYFRNVPYPSAQVVPATNYAPTAADPIDAKAALADYVGANWDAGRIAKRVKLAADWAAANKRRVMCTEFGVVRKGVPPPARYQWLADTRNVLEGSRVDWTVADYADLFGIVTLAGETVTESDGAIRLADPTQGSRTIEPDAIKALFAN